MLFPINVNALPAIIAELLEPVLNNKPFTNPKRFPFYSTLIGNTRAETRLGLGRSNNIIVVQKNEVRPFDDIRFNPENSGLIEKFNAPQPIKPNYETKAKDYRVYDYSYQFSITIDDLKDTFIQFNWLNNEKEMKLLLAQKMTEVISDNINAFVESFYNTIESMIYQALSTGIVNVPLKDGTTATWDYTFFGMPISYTVSTLWTSSTSDPLLDIEQILKSYVNNTTYNSGLGGQHKAFAIFMPMNVMDAFRKNPNIRDYLRNQEISAFQGDISEIIDNKNIYLKPIYEIRRFNALIYEYYVKKRNNTGVYSDIFSDNDRILVVPMDVDLFKLYSKTDLAFDMSGKLIDLGKSMFKTENNLIYYSIEPIRLTEGVFGGYRIVIQGGFIIVNRAPEVVNFVKVI